jgi:hypothetical protein
MQAAFRTSSPTNANARHRDLVPISALFLDVLISLVKILFITKHTPLPTEAARICSSSHEFLVTRLCYGKSGQIPVCRVRVTSQVGSIFYSINNSVLLNQLVHNFSSSACELWIGLRISNSAADVLQIFEKPFERSEVWYQVEIQLRVRDSDIWGSGRLSRSGHVVLRYRR